MGNSKSLHRIPKDELKYLKGCTSFSKRQISKFYKKFMAEFPDGKLQKDAFLSFYSKSFPKGDPKLFCDHVFRSFDLDRNGYVDFREFLLALQMTSKDSEPREKLSWAFNLYDTDGNWRKIS